MLSRIRVNSHIKERDTGLMRKVKIICMLCAAIFPLLVSGAGYAHAEAHRYVAVYLDAHYGGRDRGPVIGKKVLGKDVTVVLAKAIQRELMNFNIKAFLSRDEDIFIPLGDRWFHAKKKGADIYLSLRLRFQDKDCVQIYTAKRRAYDDKTAKQSGREKAAPASADEDRARESSRLAVLLSKNIRDADRSLSSIVASKKDIIFETADFPTVIAEFGIARTAQQHSYILEQAMIDSIAKSVATALKEFIEGPQN